MQWIGSETDHGDFASHDDYLAVFEERRHDHIHTSRKTLRRTPPAVFRKSQELVPLQDRPVD